MRTILFFILAQFCTLNFCQAQNPDWELVTPFLQKESILKMEILPDGSYLAHKNNNNDDLLITEDNGKTWRQINDNAKTVYDFTVHNNKGYAVIGGSLRITDPKFSTPGVSYPIPGSAKSIFVLNDSTIFIASQNSRMYKSVNGGATWTTTIIPTVYQDKIMSVYFTDANIGYCVSDATVGNSFIFKTTDGGQTWNIVSTSSKEFIKILFKDSLNGVATRANGDPLYTSDGGNTWDEVTGIGTLNDVKVYNNEFIAIGNPNKLYRSANGQSWTNTIMYPSSFHAFTCLATSPDFILAGTNNESGSSALRHTIFKSTDLQTWNPLIIKWVYPTLYKKVYASDNLAVVPDFGYFSQDRGYTWGVALNTPYPVGPMNILPNGKGIALGLSQFWITNDNGLTWTQQTTPNLFLRVPAMKPNGDYAIANMGANSSAFTGFVSTYSASTGWSPQVNVESEVTSMKFIDNNVGFLVNQTKIMKTVDGGLTWTAVSNFPGAIADVRNIVFGNSSRIYFGKYYTTNLGSSWTAVPSPMSLFKDYDIFSDGTGYGMDIDRNVYKTINYGASWQKIITTQLLLTPGSTINKVAFAKNYMVAVGGTGFYVVDFVTTNLSTNDSTIRTENMMKVYPNPTSSILFFEGKDQVKNIIVFDISGKIFKNIENSKSNTIDISDLAKGIYFIKIISENTTYVKKVIKN
ncbi:T9SS type A sorting domain-containing protein [Chryseobacterium gleum]|uniref:T9SS type A sorting domain-containing protein n=1 Tax=Chryseobacterium gleum TaxID=250 RepID=UPI001E3A7AB6|nr:T9SS type A sorting domain-containing protein [Chryseobacterium gleum]MCE4065478.1 T9SS type A sorting domain-containing protein [Chryseobacterium gleum]